MDTEKRLVQDVLQDVLQHGQARRDRPRLAALLLVSALMGACAGVDEMVSEPRISLREVQLTELEFTAQRFQLDFDVTNPNPFPLPVRSVSYGLKLGGHRFASGSTPAAFTVPAAGDGGFAISVDLDLMRTAPELLFIVRESAFREIPYALEGKLEVDLPFAKPLRFEETGTVRLANAVR